MNLFLLAIVISTTFALSPIYQKPGGRNPSHGCDGFTCDADSKCFEVGDSSCDNPNCSKVPRCIRKDQITCDNIRCKGPCIMVLQSASYGTKGVPTPQCFPGYGGGDTDGGDQGSGSMPGADEGRLCPLPPSGPPGTPCVPHNCQTCCKPSERCESIQGICEPIPGDPRPICCPPIIRCHACPQTDPCKDFKCPYGQECSVIFPPCAPFTCCPAQAHCTATTEKDSENDESGGYN